jgi:hypothetical protein
MRAAKRREEKAGNLIECGDSRAWITAQQLQAWLNIRRNEAD